MAEQNALTGRQVIARLVRRVIACMVLGAAAIYLIDYALLRIRIATNRSAYGTVTVRPYYAVPRKDHRTEFLFDDPRDETCVHALFPHLGHDPCWYLNRHQERRINL
ncbi:MAG: hypothetical protein JO033_20110 [Acidobacteriaceae bacterium]|nr:hypothetical protein [Acidobacteriaceae bacterium]MBV9498719.1 hypothetical protein [Acidobacteriaceae bacterium]